MCPRAILTFMPRPQPCGLNSHSNAAATDRPPTMELVTESGDSGLQPTPHIGQVFVDRNRWDQVWQLSNVVSCEVATLPLAFEDSAELVFDEEGCACIAAGDAEPLLVDEALGLVVLRSMDDTKFLARREQSGDLIVQEPHDVEGVRLGPCREHFRPAARPEAHRCRLVSLAEVFGAPNMGGGGVRTTPGHDLEQQVLSFATFGMCRVIGQVCGPRALVAMHAPGCCLTGPLLGLRLLSRSVGSVWFSLSSIYKAAGFSLKVDFASTWVHKGMRPWSEFLDAFHMSGHLVHSKPYGEAPDPDDAIARILPFVGISAVALPSLAAAWVHGARRGCGLASEDNKAAADILLKGLLKGLCRGTWHIDAALGMDAAPSQWPRPPSCSSPVRFAVMDGVVSLAALDSPDFRERPRFACFIGRVFQAVDGRLLGIVLVRLHPLVVGGEHRSLGQAPPLAVHACHRPPL